MLTPLIASITPDQIIHWGPTVGLPMVGLWLFWKTRPNPEENPPIEIIFDRTNPARRFWSFESPKDEKGNIKRVFWEYRVEIKNKASHTVRNVSGTTEHTGQLPVRPVDQVFDKIKKTSCDLKPGCSELVPVVRWPHPKIQAGMLAGPSALEYGPVKVTVSADDVPPTVRVFRFDYQVEPMLFD